MLLERQSDITRLTRFIEQFPVTAILGPRQCGKTTLARTLHGDHYFDLENPRDVGRFDNPQLTLEDLKGFIIIDEIQRKPDLFPLLRFLVDSKPDQKYLILGSASRDLIKQSSESLAGRIAYYELSGFSLDIVGHENRNMRWLRGGLPPSFLSKDDLASSLWRESYIQTFMERDIPQLGIYIPAAALRRFWIMLSHYHGQLVNYSEIGRSFGASEKTVKQYMDILEGTFMIRVLRPWFSNVGKRLVKSPKLYIRDSGIFHTLQTIDSMEQLFTHNKLGASWEGFVLEEAIHLLNNHNVYFWRTHNGAEIDVFWQHGGKSWGAEIKFADTPKITIGLRNAVEDLSLSHLWIIYPGSTTYRADEKVTVLSIDDISQLGVL